MKVLFNKTTYFFLGLLMMFSCEDFLGGDLNVDPNKPATVPVSAQIPSIEINLADVYGGAFSRFNCMLTQQVEGVNRQWSSMNAYSGLTPIRFNAAWENVYENILIEIRVARATATEGGFNHYQGILNVIEAFTLLMSTDVWDDMPYTEALQGSDNISPAFDSQESIYTTALNRLENAIALLEGPVGGVAPGSDDLFYGGNKDAWIKAANAIKARTHMKQNDYLKAAAAAAASFASAADNLSYTYPDEGAASPWYRFNRDREGDIAFHPEMDTLMMDLNDTFRLEKINPAFLTTHPYMTAVFDQEMITYREMQFVIAESDFRENGGTQAGHDAYLAGIKASFDRLGLGDTEYNEYVAQSSVDPGVGNLTLEHIMTQKYIAMYLQPEVYSDWRRTNIPSLEPVTGTTIPVRWHYSSDEYLFNANAPSEADIDIFTDKVGWDE